MLSKGEYESAEKLLLSKKVNYFDWLRMKGTTSEVYNAIIEAMDEYAKIKENKREKLLHEVVDAWESLSGGKNYSPREVSNWLRDDMKPIMDKIRKEILRSIPENKPIK